MPPPNTGKFGKSVVMLHPRGGGGLPYESDGDARRLAWGVNCRFWSLLGFPGRKAMTFTHTGIA